MEAEVVADEAKSPASPLYAAVTVSEPTGVLMALQYTVPFDSVAVHRSVSPVLKVTVPVGVPFPEVGVTVAEYSTA